ncbi:MAG: dockerin type I domain-containing protein [Saprospiraceae bacterium]
MSATKQIKILVLMIGCCFFFIKKGNTQIISLGNSAACQLDTVSVPIYIDAPTSVGAITFSIDYDTSVLAFAQFSGMMNSLATNGFSTYNDVDGQVRFVWFSGGTTAAAVNDTIIYMDFIGKVASIHTLAWDVTSSSKSEVVDVLGNTINISFVNGTADIQTSPTTATLSTPNTTICDNDLTIFTATNGATYEFYINGQVAQLKSSLATYSTDSLKNNDTVTVQVFNAIGCSYTPSDIPMFVNELPIGTMTGDTAVCSGEAILLNFSLSNAGTYDLVVQNGINTLNTPSLSGNAQLNLTPTDTTDYVLQMVTNTATGCFIDNIKDTVKVILYPLPVVELGNDTTMCSDETITLDAGSDGVLYTWSGGELTSNLVVDSTNNYAVTVTDVNNCITKDSVNVLVDCFTLTGNLYYPNSANTPLTGITMQLVDANGILVNLPSNGTGNSVTTDATGDYRFSKVPIGVYYIEPNIKLPHGGLVSGVDAFIVPQFFAKILPLNSLAQKAADVNADGFINAADALLIEQRSIGDVSFFPAGDWVTDRDIIEVTNDDIIRLLRAICTGDLNSSYIP